MMRVSHSILMQGRKRMEDEAMRWGGAYGCMNENRAYMT